MKTIKITGFNGQSMTSSLAGEQILLPEDSQSINDFQFQKVENNVRYFIEISPDKNYPINFIGIKIAMQIYFYHLNNNMLQFEIVLFGFDSKESIFWHSSNPYFFKCPNISYRQIELDTRWDYSNNIKIIDKKEAIEVLKNIGIKPPTSYKSHHSITNEWSIFRWSSYLGIQTPLEKEVENSLYFQYLKAINEIDQIIESKNFLVSGKGNVLLIDDEEEKGWNEYFRNLFKFSHSIKFDSVGKGFKNRQTKKDIIEEAVSKIISFQPDIIILDLRLHDSDFDQHKPEELTGYSILEQIKNEINNGIQVILFSASNKIWNYQTLAEIGFDGWVLKESPELSVDPHYTQNAIKNLKAQIDQCFERVYLKTIYKDTQELVGIIDQMDYESNFLETIKTQLKLSYYLLSRAEKKEQFAYAFVSLYMVIETVNTQFVTQDKKSEYWYVDGEQLKNWTYADRAYLEYAKLENKVTGETSKVEFVKGSKPPEWQKMAGLYFQKWGGENHPFIRNIYHLINKRNWFIHNDDKLNHTVSKDCVMIYPNHDIFNSVGFMKLFDIVKQIINHL